MKRCGFVVVFVFSLVASSALAQVQTGEIFGVVSDPDSLPVPGVLVTLTPQTAQGIEQSTTTNIRGLYRFPTLSLGTYNVAFQLDGFATIAREQIPVHLGTTTNLPVRLELATVAESLVVVGQAPVVDPRRTSNATNFGADQLEHIPSARDPWAILEQTPGLMPLVQNVGGNNSMSGYAIAANGTYSRNNTWLVDGVNITSNDVQGAPANYFDIDAYEEIQVVTGGQDTRIRTAGISVNFVSKQGTNDFHGEGYTYYTGGGFQSDNRDAELEARGVGETSTSLERFYDYGFNIGGPILRDRLWFWFGYSVQRAERYVVGFIDETGCSFEEAIFTPEVCPAVIDPDTLEYFNANASWQAGDNNKATFAWTHGEKYSPYQFPNIFTTLSAQVVRAPTTIVKVEDQHVFSDSFFVNAKFAHNDNGFKLLTQDEQEPVAGSQDGLLGLQPIAELGTGRRLLRNTSLVTRNTHPLTQFNFDTNYFIDSWAAASHEFKAGFEARLASHYDLWMRSANVLPITWYAESWLAAVQKNAIGNWGTDQFAFYLQDTIVWDRLTLNLGLRFDHQTAYEEDSTSPAATVDGVEFMPATSHQGRGDIIGWKDISPRLGFTYDFDGEGRTILRGNYARYVEELGGSSGTRDGISTGWFYATYLWDDVNGDLFVQADEMGPMVFTNFNFDDPSFSPISIDPDLRAPKTDELILGIEHELFENFSLSGNFIYRRDTDLQFVLNTDVSLDDFVPYGESSTNTGQTFTAWTYVGNGGVFRETRNAPASGLSSGYRGVEITARKRFSDGWQLMASLTVGRNTLTTGPEYNRAGLAFGPNLSPNPNNVNFINEGIGIFGNGKFNDSRWIFKLTGSYELPWGLMFSGFLNMRDGNPIGYRKFGEPPPGTPGLAPNLRTEPIGDSRYDTIALFDWRIEKSFELGYGRIVALFDMFNTFNANTVLDMQKREDAGNFGDVFDYLGLRVFRLGVRYVF